MANSNTNGTNGTNGTSGILSRPARHVQASDLISEPDEHPSPRAKTSTSNGGQRDHKDQKFAFNPNIENAFISNPPPLVPAEPSMSNLMQSPLASTALSSRQIERDSDRNKGNDGHSSRDRGHRSQSDVDDFVDKKEISMAKLEKFLLHPAMIGFYAALFVFILLCIIQPQFIMKKKPLSTRDAEFASQTQRHMLRQRQQINWITVTVVSLITGVLAGVTPFVVDQIIKSIEKNKTSNSSNGDGHHHSSNYYDDD